MTVIPSLVLVCCVVAVFLMQGAAAAEAALALSTDEILPAGLVDYFLVVRTSRACSLIEFISQKLFNEMVTRKIREMFMYSTSRRYAIHIYLCPLPFVVSGRKYESILYLFHCCIRRTDTIVLFSYLVFHLLIIMLML